MSNQEEYLSTTSAWEVIKRCIKKALLELTSVKFWLLCFICAGIWYRHITDYTGLIAALVLVGAREVQIESILPYLRR